MNLHHSDMKSLLLASEMDINLKSKVIKHLDSMYGSAESIDSFQIWSRIQEPDLRAVVYEFVQDSIKIIANSTNEVNMFNN